jgi:GWxTD domain-containing protein
MRQLLFCLTLVLLTYTSLPAQWKCAVKKGLDKGSNTRLFLAYKASSDSDKEFMVDIRFRPKGKFRDFLRKETRLKTKGDKVFAIPFRLPIGEYEVDISIEDMDLGTLTHLVPDDIYKCRKQEIDLSDIYLSYTANATKAFEEPLVDLSLNPDMKLYYFIELQATRAYKNLNISAFLFKDKKSSQVNSGPTRTYTSIYETRKNQGLNPNEKARISDVLELAGLEGGEYLLSVEVFNGATRLGGVDARFVIGGDIKQLIMQPDFIDDAILMMEYILPLPEIENLLDNPDPEAKLVAFQKVWTDLYEEEAESQMEAYYATVLKANELFKDDLPGRKGWQSDRGKIFIEFGEPEINEVNIKGKDCQRWIYAKWSMAFLFEKRNQGYYLIE